VTSAEDSTDAPNLSKLLASLFSGKITVTIEWTFRDILETQSNASGEYTQARDQVF